MSGDTEAGMDSSNSAAEEEKAEPSASGNEGSGAADTPAVSDEDDAAPDNLVVEKRSPKSNMLAGNEVLPLTVENILDKTEKFFSSEAGEEEPSEPETEGKTETEETDTEKTSVSQNSAAMAPASVDGGEEVQIEWDLDDFPEHFVSGSYTARAILPDEYVLAEDAEEISVTVRFSEVMMLSADADLFAPYEVDGMTPSGTVVNVFDYWIGEDRTESDNKGYSDNYNTGGINRDHSFKFGKGMKSDDNQNGSINAWTKSNAPRTGIVENTLRNGYPYFKEGLNAEIDHVDEPTVTKAESTDYLFDPGMDEVGKKAFQNADGLFQIDENGYYYYNSQENFAWFDENAGQFHLYHTWGVKKGGTSPDGQFFPFNGPGHVFQVEEGTPVTDGDGKLQQAEGINSVHSGINHYFGLAMSTRFVQKNGGKTYSGNAITYEFSGDDDVWVFIDDVLVADLGGIHDRASLSINFATGQIQINGEDNGTLKSKFETAGKVSENEWRGNTFDDETYHTLKFFYLERGNTDSNMSLKFNLLPIPESEIIKTDQEGNPMSGITFRLYPAEKNGEEYTIKHGYENSPIFEGVTEAGTGRLRLLDENGSPLTFKEFHDEYNTPYFILQEETPEGYSAVPDTDLFFNEETGLIMAENYWETGSYASPKVTTTATTRLYKGTAQATRGEMLLDLSKADLKDNPPIIFAVAFKRLDMDISYTEENNWAPVYGTVENGFTVLDDSSVKMEDRIKKAAEANAADGEKNKFELTSGGAFQVLVEDLPGEVENYYWYAKQEGKTEDELDAAVEYTINYYLMQGEEAVRLYTDDFTREFSTAVYVANVKDYLVVEKVNEQGEPMNDAKFALYRADDVTVNTDGTVSLDSLSGNPYDSGATGTLSRINGDKVTGEGLLVFPTKGKTLENGTYYLIETASGNSDYKVNPHAVSVIVDDTGVYADAGTENDGISTERYVESALKSMLRFPIDDGTDATLHNIRAQLLETDTYTLDDAVWSKWKDSPADGEEQHLEYAPKEGFLDLDYALSNEKAEEEKAVLRTETGWNKLAVRQCLNVEHYEDASTTNGGTLYTKEGSKVQDLGEQDLSNLFPSVLCIRVENEPVVEKTRIPVEKVWNDGNNQDGSRPGSVTVKLLADGKETGNELTLNESNDWKGSFTGLPVYEDGTKIVYTVKETAVPGYASSISGDAENGFVITNTPEPDEPETEPDEPETEPDEPETEPDEPESPDGQIPPSRPNEPGQQPNAGQPENNLAPVEVEAAKTGDMANPVLWITLLAVSGAGLTAALVLGKRRPSHGKRKRRKCRK